MLRAKILTPWALLGYGAFYGIGVVAAGDNYRRLGGDCQAGQEGCFAGGYGEMAMMNNVSKKGIGRAITGANIAECNLLKQRSVENNKDQQIYINYGGVDKPSAEEQAQCMARKKKIMDERARLIEEARVKPIDMPETAPTCVNKLNKPQARCQFDTLVNKMLEEPKVKIQIMSNVGELWTHQADTGKDVLEGVVVVENIGWEKKYKKPSCTTFFPKADLQASLNSVGSVIKLVGTPSKPEKNVGCENVCGVDPANATLEGRADKCGTSCDPYSMLLNKNAFKTYSPEKAEKKKAKKKHDDSTDANDK